MNIFTSRNVNIYLKNVKNSSIITPITQRRRCMKKVFAVVFSMLFASSCRSACTKKESSTIKIGVNLELTGYVSVYGFP